MKTELFTENADTFTKLYEEIKRFCVLPKFAKKYKVLAKLKSIPSVNGMASAHFYKCFRYSDSMQYSVRIIDLYQLSEYQQIQVLRETAILRKIDHPSIIRLYEVYEDEANVFIVSELLLGKDMKSKENDLLAMDEKSVSDLIWKLLHAIHHMHSRGIIHRDIRLENIYFRQPANNYNDICITNFMSAEIANELHNPQIIKPTIKKWLGTPGYIAPEMMIKQPNAPSSSTTSPQSLTSKADIFALGAIFYFLVFGRLPMEGRTVEETLRLNEKCEIDFASAPMFRKFTSSAIDLMKRMLEKDPAKRGDAGTLMNHTWLVSMRNRNSRSEYGDDTSSGGGGGSVNGNNSNSGFDDDDDNGAFHTLSTVMETSEAINCISSLQQIDSRIQVVHNFEEGSAEEEEDDLNSDEEGMTNTIEDQKFKLCKDFDTLFDDQ